jgi:PAS domain S-box-containing protein
MEPQSMLRDALRHLLRRIHHALGRTEGPKDGLLEAEHAAIIASSEDAIISKRLDGTVTSWNPSAERLFGYTAAEAIGQPGTFLMPPDRRNEEKDIIARLIRNERIEHFETVRRHKDGRDFHVSLSISPIKDEAGRVVGAAKIVRDITSRKFMEQSLQLSEERYKAIAQKNEALYRDAQEANRLKDEFLATLSHELRTPLNAIYGWVHMARANVLDDEGMANALETIDRNARTLCKLIDELLDVSRIITGKLHLDCHRIDVTEVVREAVAVIRPTVLNKGLRLEVSADTETLPFWGDATRLQQAIWNLLSNAVKFTPAGGSVRVRTARVGTDIQITISDTGEGIEAAFLPFVFDRFRQADSTSSRKYGGLGLGLSLVRFISELHGGTVEVQSAGPGLGASFTITLPVNVRQVDRTADDIEDTAIGLARGPLGERSLRDRHVLVVEDEGDARRMLAALLESHGATVTAVGTTEEAIAALRECKPDVILSDIGLPGKDGYALIEQIRSFPEADRRNLRVIAVTAHARNEDKTKALSAGYDAHIAKPFDAATLLKAVTAAYL